LPALLAVPFGEGDPLTGLDLSFTVLRLPALRLLLSVLLTQAIHALDLMLAYAGPVVEVAGIAATTRLHRMETEDFAAAGLIFANGAPGSLVATTAAYPGGPERLTLVGTRATATLSLITLKPGCFTAQGRDQAGAVWLAPPASCSSMASAAPSPLSGYSATLARPYVMRVPAVMSRSRRSSSHSSSNSSSKLSAISASIRAASGRGSFLFSGVMALVSRDARYVRVGDDP
jgi:hypothetical protein